MLLYPILSAAVFLACAVPSFAGSRLNRFGSRDASGQPELGLVKTPDVFTPTPVARSNDVSARWMTNGERLARNLPPNPPKRRDPSKRLAARLAPSPCPQATNTGALVVKDTSGNIKGYVQNSYAWYGLFRVTQNPSEALMVSVKYDALSGNVPAIVTMVNPLNANLPLLGVIPSTFNVGHDLGPGSNNYVHLGGIGQPGTPRGSVGSESIGNSITTAIGTPRTSQSDVWTFNSASKTLVPVWVNSNSQPVTFAMYFGQVNNEIVGVGDYAAYTARFGSSWTGPLSLQVLPIGV